MQSASVNGVDLEYEVSGSGEPVLLISPVIADGFLPLWRNRRSPAATSSSGTTSAAGSEAPTPRRP